MKRLILFATIFAIVAGAMPGLAYTTSTSGGVQLKWKNGAVIPYRFNTNFAPNNDAALVRAAIKNAGQTLMNALPAGALRFEDAGTTAVNKSGCDGTYVITFTGNDPNDILPAGVIAQARFASSTGSGSGTLCGVTDNFFPGQIVDVDMLFNTAANFSTSQVAPPFASGTQQIFDIESIALHEASHWLGIDHTGVMSAVMSPFGDSGDFPLRSLHSDDVAALRSVYSSNPGPALSGTITLAGGGGNVKGAHVVATDANTGLPVVSAVTGGNGQFRMVGLPAGSYRIHAEPLDGPVFIGDVDEAFAGGNENFTSSFLTNPVTFGAVDVTGVNLQVQAPGSGNLDRLGVGTGGGQFVIGTAPVAIRRGADSTIIIGQSLTVGGAVTFSSSKVTVRPPLTPQQNFQFVDVTVAPDAPLGAVNILYGPSAASPVTAYTGGLYITANPTLPPAGVVDGAAFNQNTSAPHFAPGSIISLFGTELAGPAAANGIQGLALPLPTQLGGISVVIGNRLAPLFFVHPGQVNAMVPYELPAGNVDVAVRVGNNVESSKATITLGTTAPRLFRVNPAGQGAILIANSDVLVAPAGSIPGRTSRAANRGEFIQIYCTGLGKVNNAPASGLPGNGETVAAGTNVQVTIGGVNVDMTQQFIFAGLAPGFVGLNQVNVPVPNSVTPGNAVPVVVRTAHGTSNTVTIAVQ